MSKFSLPAYYIPVRLIPVLQFPAPLPGAFLRREGLHDRHGQAAHPRNGQQVPAAWRDVEERHPGALFAGSGSPACNSRLSGRPQPRADTLLRLDYPGHDLVLLL